MIYDVNIPRNAACTTYSLLCYVYEERVMVYDVNVPRHTAITIFGLNFAEVISHEYYYCRGYYDREKGCATIAYKAVAQPHKK